MIDTDDLVLTDYKKFGWRSEDGGLDCLGVVLEVYRKLGGDFERFRTEFFDSFADRSEVALWATLPSRFRRVELASRPGDVIACEFDGERHVAVFIGNGSCLHATEATGIYLMKYRVMRRLQTACYRLLGVR